MGCLLTITAPPAHILTEYWTLDELGAVDRIGSVTGLHWPAFPATIAVPALYSNGIRLNTAPVESGLDQSGSPVLAYNDTASKGLSVWFWIRLIAGPSAFNPETLVQFTFFDTIGPQFSGLFVEYFSQSSVVQATHFGDVPGTNFQTSHIFTPAIGDWHMLAATFDKVNALLSLYIDGFLVSSVPDPSTSISGDSGALSLFNAGGVGPNAFTVDVDEFGVSTLGSITPSQILDLFNTGIGVTWPQAGTIVPP